MSNAEPQPELVEVQLLAMSLPAYRYTTEHHDELLREFRLILAREPSPGHSVPARLLEVIDELDRRFAGFTAGTQGELDAALDKGLESVDLVYRVPPELKDGVTHVLELLVEADEYCRQGDLLTLAPPPDAVRFREWFLEQFVDQIDGKPPVRWSDTGER